MTGFDAPVEQVMYIDKRLYEHNLLQAIARVNRLATGNRWASCSPNGNLAFHWKCMMAPQTIIDYIVVHELCHFHHLDHTDAFWNEVDKALPSYGERKEWLRLHGAGLDV